MGYIGNSVSIPLGDIGLKTDDASTRLPANALTEARNVRFIASRIEKDGGTVRYTSAPLDGLVGASATLTASNDQVGIATHGLSNGTPVELVNLATTTSVTESTTYYVINANTNDFQLSLTVGGSAVDIDLDGTADVYRLDVEIVALFDFWPTPQNQRLVALTDSGKIFRDTGDGSFNSGTAVKTGLGTPTSDAMMTTCGNEDAGFNKRLVVFPGTAEPQVFDGDASSTRNFGMIEIGNCTFQNTGETVTYNGHGLSNGERVRFLSISGPTTISNETTYYVISSAANTFQLAATAGGSAINLDANGTGVLYRDGRSADWLSTNPTFGVLHEGKFWVFGNSNRLHTIYYSTGSNHEDFVRTGSGELNVFPGEGDQIVSAISYKNRLFIFKRPFGVYLIDTTDPTLANWRVYKLSDYFGAASPNSILTALDDILGGNSTGSITSANATDALGDVEAGDVLSNGQVEQYIRELVNVAGVSKMQCLYYAEKKIAMFTYASAASGSTDQDLILYIDVNKQGTRFSINDKDSAASLTLRRDSNNIPRPIYGGYDGHVYLMDQLNRNIADSAYTGDFTTAETDFSFLDPSLGVKNKLFDFVTLIYKEQTQGTLELEYYINGGKVETLSFPNSQGKILGEFLLDTDTLGGSRVVRRRLPLKGKGNTIKFRVFNNSLNQTFDVEQIIVDFRVGDEANNR